MTVYPTLRLRFPFELMDMGDSTVAVPVDKGADEFHGVIKLQNESAKMMFTRLQEGISLPDLIYVCMEAYPDSTVEDVGPKVLAFLDDLRKSKVLMADVSEGVSDPTMTEEPMRGDAP